MCVSVKDLVSRIYKDFLQLKSKGNGNPLQHSCLENPRDEGAWWAAVYGAAQGWTRLSALAAAARINKSV